MKRFAIVCVCLTLMLVPVWGAFAQHEHEPGAAAPPAGGAAQPSPAAQPSMRGGAMMRPGAGGDGMMGRDMMAMCPMMTRPSMMQAAMTGETDPTSIGLAEAMGASNMETMTIAHMLQMRGEILQAIGGIMLKHGRALEQER
jgi:hypothetical protein